MSKGTPTPADAGREATLAGEVSATEPKAVLEFCRRRFQEIIDGAIVDQDLVLELSEEAISKINSALATSTDLQPPTGALEVGTSGDGEVIVNHPDLQPDANGVGHIIFSPTQAVDFANLLIRKAIDAAQER
jgi:hypothetical protein